ncbi:MAG: DUF2806 domain-containing protein [Bacteroidia bacterium]
MQRRRLARADADALLIRTKSESEANKIKRKDETLAMYSQAEAEVITDLIKNSPDIKQRAANRFMHKIMAEQENLENITYNAISLLESDKSRSGSKKIPDDWIYRFVDYAKEISDEDVQNLWSRILSDQASGKHNFSMHTLDVLRKMSRPEIEIFIEYCRYFNFFGLILIYETHLGFNHNLMEQEFLDLSYGFQELRDIGLLYSARIGTPTTQGSPENIFIFGKRQLFLKPVNSVVIEPHQYILTTAGRELSRLVKGFNIETPGEGRNQEVEGKVFTDHDIQLFTKYSLSMLEAFGFGGRLEALLDDHFVPVAEFGIKG